MAVKTKLNMLAWAVAGFFVFSPAGFSQTNQNSTATTRVLAPPRPTGRTSATSPLELMKRMLNLSDEQVRRLQPILKEHQDEIAFLRHDTSLSHAVKSVKMRDIQAATTAKIKSLLTPEQAAKWPPTKQSAQRKPQQLQFPQKSGTANPKANESTK